MEHMLSQKKRTLLAVAAFAVLMAVVVCATGAGTKRTQPQKMKIVFVGDVLLSRLVESQISKSPDSNPWAGMKKLFFGADAVIGNLEGAAGGKSDCRAGIPANLCFHIKPERLKLLRKAGFTAMSLENNHSTDTGAAGKSKTAALLAKNGVDSLVFNESPWFKTADGVTISVVPLDLTGGDVAIDDMEWQPVIRRVRLAAALSDAVFVFIHWGIELRDWPDEKMNEVARKLFTAGADAIIGSHPHVVIEPGEVGGNPVFYSLGNNLFDQKYDVTKRGLAVVCEADAISRNITCHGIATRVPGGTYFPVANSQNAGGKKFAFPMNKLPDFKGVTLKGVSRPSGKTAIAGYKNGKKLWESNGCVLDSVSAGDLDGDSVPELVSIEEHFSDIDNEIAPRPHVYRVTDKKLVALWRGSALARPLIDATVLCGNGCALCAFHRGDTFLAPGVGADNTRTDMYHWNGFGFSAAEFSEPLQKNCESYFQNSRR